jgi:hypothetical protein
VDTPNRCIIGHPPSIIRTSIPGVVELGHAPTVLVLLLPATRIRLDDANIVVKQGAFGCLVNILEAG